MSATEPTPIVAPTWSLRHATTPADCGQVREIVASTGFFNPGEIDIAVELVEERIAKGEASGYHFVFVDSPAGTPLGYTCYGLIPCTDASYDLYWIAVRQSEHGRGWGRILLEESERQIRAAGGRQVYIETSNRPQYQPTRGFYLRCGYERAAIFPDFYAVDDDKVVYVKRL